VFLRSSLLDEIGVDHGFGTRLSERAAVPGLLFARQVHGARVLQVPPLAADAQADGLATDEPGVAVGVLTADCVPILIAEAEGRAVGAVHAGWRGSAQGVAEAAVGFLAETLRCPPTNLVAAIGPHIGPCCYEVDEPVHQAIGVESVFSPSGRPGHYRLNLFELNRSQLLRAGISPERVQGVEGCTACDATRYYSYRRDGHTGRLIHYIRRPLRTSDLP
jgi:YfiH family protein